MRKTFPGIIDEIVATYDVLPGTNHLSHRPLPSHTAVRDMIEGLKEILYPGYFGRRYINRANIKFHIGDRVWQIDRMLTEQVYLSTLHECKLTQVECGHCETLAKDTSIKFLHRIPAIRASLAEDVQAAFDGDPAARSLDEIIFSYPGLEAITVHRIAHELWELKVPLVPRMMSGDRPRRDGHRHPSRGRIGGASSSITGRGWSSARPPTSAIM